jgi:hypothetical protein
MNEKDVVNLYQSLARCRDGFMQTEPDAMSASLCSA